MKDLLLLPVATASLRRRWSAFAGSFVALSLGVALLSGVGMLVHGAQGSDDPQAPSLYKLLVFAAGAAAFVSVFVVANTFAFAVAQRSRETALLRAIGATAGQVRRLVLGEALMVAAAASIAGGLAGLAFAPAFASWLVHVGVAPQGFGARHALVPLPIAAAVGLIVAIVGTGAALWRADTVSPVEAMQDAAADRRTMTPLRWSVAGHNLIGGAFFVVVYLMNPAMLLNDPGMRGPEIKLTWAMIFALAAMTVVISVAPAIVPPLVRVFTLPAFRVSGATWLLARQNALTAVRRTISTAVPTFLVIGTVGCVLGAVTSFGDAWTVQEQAALSAPFVAEHPTPEAVARLKAVPGLTVATVASFIFTDPKSDAPTDYAAGPVVADAVDGDASRIWNLTLTAGSLAQLEGDGVAASSDLARYHKWQIGDRLSGQAPDGRKVSLHLVATYRPIEGSAELLMPATTAAVSTPVTAFLSGSTTADALSRSTGTPVRSAHDWLASRVTTSKRYDRITMLAITGPPVLYALIAIINTMVMATADRKRDFTVLRLAGNTRGQVLRMVALESALIVVIATLLGAAVTVGMQYAVRAMIDHDVLSAGQSVQLNVPWLPLAASAAVCMTLAIAASVLPARLTLRANHGTSAAG